VFADAFDDMIHVIALKHFQRVRDAGLGEPLRQFLRAKDDMRKVLLRPVLDEYGL